MYDLQSFIALTRFGSGAAPGDWTQIEPDPHSWLLTQLRQPAPAPELSTLHSSAALFEQMRTVREARKAAKADGQPKPQMGTPLRDILLAEVGARTRLAAGSATPLYERLVTFWSNHFTVSTMRGELVALAGAFEREAIRPHVFGKFRDLLLATATHPGMLLYLDNAKSIGPNSIAGRRRDKGLNENYARELMELHTLGVGNYTQADVTTCAKVFTGWTLEHGQGGPQGRFMFEPRFHEPGDKSLLNVTIREAGVSEGVALLDMLSRHSSTAHFIATKLVRHFIADDPPKPAVDAVAATFHATDGDLTATMRTLIQRPEAWQEPLAKVRTPNDLVVATLRALGNPPVEDKMIFRSLVLLGQAPFGAPSPAGWPDRADGWLGPEALMRRIEWAHQVGQRVPSADATKKALELADATIGPVMSPATRQAISSAADAREATMLWIASREFERR
ncbi:MAG TPA: DUF1800 domain-containing protein [Magnetospirillaceae bacterium]|jgi:uncharacterized protein (DUF1800 family)